MLLIAMAFVSCKNNEHRDLKDGLYAEIKTTKGDILLQLNYQKAPITVANFVSLAEGTNQFVDKQYSGRPFYDGLKFHRVIKNFMIQGGDPLGTGEGGPGYKFNNEISDLRHDKPGVLAMANAGPNTNGSQFYITRVAKPNLDGGYSIFGQVVDGQKVVDSIQINDVMNSVKIIRIGEAAKRFDAVKTFGDYFARESDNHKKTEAKAAEEQKAYLEKYKAVFAKKSAELALLRKTTQKTSSGLEYKILRKGSGKKPAPGDKVYMTYAGYFENGILFDSNDENSAKESGKFDELRASQGGYSPMPFAYGSQMIPGFTEGLNLMTFGEKMFLYIPSKLAYGEEGAGHGIIPPNSNLVFEVELLENPGDAPTHK